MRKEIRILRNTLFSLNVNSGIDLDCDAPDLTHYFSQFSVLKSTIKTTKP